jgi:hypothetical protein
MTRQGFPGAPRRQRHVAERLGERGDAHPALDSFGAQTRANAFRVG